MTFVRCRTVTKVDSMIHGAQVDPVLREVVVEREQLVEIIADLRDDLSELRPVGSLERAAGVESVAAVLVAVPACRGSELSQLAADRERREEGGEDEERGSRDQHCLQAVDEGLVRGRDRSLVQLRWQLGQQRALVILEEEAVDHLLLVRAEVGVGSRQQTCRESSTPSRSATR
jgi:hypothetical protein